MAITFGCIGKQHHRMNAIKATTVPIKSMKSSIVGSSPNKKTLFTKYAKSSNGVIIIYVQIRVEFFIINEYIGQLLSINT